MKECLHRTECNLNSQHLLIWSGCVQRLTLCSSLKLFRRTATPFVFLAFLVLGCKKASKAPETDSYVIPNGYCSSNEKVTVTDVQVRSCFDASGQWMKHPRLIFFDREISNIKTNSSSDPFAKPTYDDIMSRANAVLGTPILNYGLDPAGLRITSIHTFANDQMPYLVLAYKFTSDIKYALRCWQQLDAMCNYPDWGANRHFLDAGIAAKAIGMSYDALYDYLSETQRSKLYSAVRNFVLEPGINQIQTNTGPFKWYLTNDNWNGVCHGGMIMAALAAYELDSAFNSKVISLCANGMLKYIQSLEPDGASEEGMSYWAYGLSNAFLALEAMKRNLGTTYGLTDQSGFKKTGMFPYLVSGPAGTATFGDDYLYYGKNYMFLSYFWFSNFFNDVSMATAHYNACLSVNASKAVKMNGWLDLLFYKKTLVGTASSSLPLSNYVRGIDYMYVLENTNDDNALYVGMHGGDNAASHGHLDAGSFFIQALGENFAVGNLGKEDPYPADYFTATSPGYNSSSTTTASTPGRYYYYRVRTEGKNCLVFNPDARPEQDPSGVATLSKQSSDGIGGFYIIDLTRCYSRDVSSYSRGIKLNRQKGMVSIQDEFTPKSISNVYWIMHSPATDGLQISADAKTATMMKNGKTFYAVISAPADAKFEKVDRSDTQINYLQETSAIFSSVMSAKNSPNKWYGKLQIRLASVTAGAPITIRVDFLKTQAANLTGVVPMNQWTTSN